MIHEEKIIFLFLFLEFTDHFSVLFFDLFQIHADARKVLVDFVLIDVVHLLFKVPDLSHHYTGLFYCLNQGRECLNGKKSLTSDLKQIIKTGFNRTLIPFISVSRMFPDSQKYG